MTRLTGKHISIIGGGPGGLMAADVLAGSGASVTVFDQMRSPGRKFLLAGRGGLNITHSEPLEDFLNRYGPDRAFLEPAIRAFNPDALRAWCNALGETTFVGSSGRVFPKSFRATPLLRAVLRRLVERGVVFHTAHRWLGWNEESGALTFTVEGDQRVDVVADATVLALGGTSWPGTGSTGNWASILGDAGIEVAPFRPANCGFVVAWSEYFAQRFAGTPLKNIAVAFDETSVRGEAMVTSTGLEGGAVYAVSRLVRGEIDQHGVATIAIDLQPERHHDAVARKLAHRKPKESTSNWMRRSLGLSPVAIGLLREAYGIRLANDPDLLARRIKSVPVRFAIAQPINRAISTAGGIAQAELDATFMLRKLPGTFAVGEMLDWEAPTGGYLLQATFATAVAAAKGTISYLS